MPKIPDDMSQATIKRREELTAEYKAKKPELPAAPPKPRIAKKR